VKARQTRRDAGLAHLLHFSACPRSCAGQIRIRLLFAGVEADNLSWCAADVVCLDAAEKCLRLDGVRPSWRVGRRHRAFLCAVAAARRTRPPPGRIRPEPCLIPSPLGRIMGCGAQAKPRVLPALPLTPRAARCFAPCRECMTGMFAVRLGIRLAPGGMLRYRNRQDSALWRCRPVRSNSAASYLGLAAHGVCVYKKDRL
jgi:hypothetical protein